MKLLALSLSLVLMSFMTFSVQAACDDEHHHDAKHSKIKKYHKKRHQKHMKKIDTNADGKIELKEYLANAEARFKELDANADGFVTTEEGKAAHKKMRKKHHEWMKNHDKHFCEKINETVDELKK